MNKITTYIHFFLFLSRPVFSSEIYSIFHRSILICYYKFVIVNIPLNHFTNNRFKEWINKYIIKIYGCIHRLVNSLTVTFLITMKRAIPHSSSLNNSIQFRIACIVCFKKRLARFGVALIFYIKFDAHQGVTLASLARRQASLAFYSRIILTERRRRRRF